jgi:hypothetical protein
MMDDNKTVFVNDGITCQFKWGWSTIFLNSGSTSSCHRCKHYYFDENSIMNFHNLEGKLEDRKKMLNGEWPGNGCEYCRDVEAVGGNSERVKFFKNNDSFVPVELFENPSSLIVSPTILEVYFNNLCNQSCIYCRPRFSSQIEQEVRFHGPSKFNIDYSNMSIDQKSKYPKYLEKFFEYMTQYGNNLKYFKMLGGEPLYQEEFNMLLDFFEKNPCPELQFDIFTNLNHDNDKLKIKLEKIHNLIQENKIKGIQFICSIDCWGPDVEYVRYGFDMEKAEKNMLMLLESKDIAVQVHATISALSLPSMYQLGQKVNEWKLKKPIFFHWNTIMAPSCFNVYHFGNTLVPYLEKFIDTLDNPIPDYQKSILGVRTRMLNSSININEINQLFGFLDELDQRRKLDWRTQFNQIVETVIRKSSV